MGEALASKVSHGYELPPSHWSKLLNGNRLFFEWWLFPFLAMEEVRASHKASSAREHVCASCASLPLGGSEEGGVGLRLAGSVCV